MRSSSSIDSYHHNYGHTNHHNSSNLHNGISHHKASTPVPGSGSERTEFRDHYQTRYAWLEKNHVNEVGSTYNSLGKKCDHKPSTWRCEDQAAAGKEFQRQNDECADKIYEIRDRSDMSREYLLNADGVAPRFYQMEADSLKNRYELNNIKQKLANIKTMRTRLFK